MKIYNLEYGAYMIEHNDKVYFFDTGTPNAGERLIVPYLKRHFPDLTKIEAIFISHYHFNHTGGAQHLLANYEVGAVYSNGTYSNDQGSAYKENDPAAQIAMEDLIAQNNVIYEAYEQGDVYNLDGFKMTALSPLPEYANKFDASTTSPNSKTSGVMMLEYGNFKVLFGGDLDDPFYVREIIDRVGDISATLWCVPHHGDFRIMENDIVNAINPDVAMLERIGNSVQSIDYLEARGIECLWLMYVSPLIIEGFIDGSYEEVSYPLKEFLKPKGMFFIN